MTLYDHILNITFHKRKWNKLSEEERKTANMYMISRFLSMEHSYIDLINEIQTINLPQNYLYDLYIGIIPKQKKYIKYIKKSVKEINGDDIKLLSEILHVSQREAQEYIDNLDKQQINALRLQVEGIKSEKKK